MPGCRTAIGVACFALALVLCASCGGSVVQGGPGGGGSAGQSVQPPSGGSTPVAGSSAGTQSGGFAGTAGSAPAPSMDAGVKDPDPVDSGCAPQDLPPPDLECDPFTPGSCGPGSGCYPFVDHPAGSGCDQQRYGTLCLPAGQGAQGALCGDQAGDYCAPGFVCVVGQRAGKRCAALCQLGSVNQCSGGLLCGELDVAGFGVCG